MLISPKALKGLIKNTPGAHFVRLLSSSATSLIEWTQQSNTEEKLIVKIKAPTRTRCGSCTSKLHFLFGSSTLSGGQVETDKWPLALARLGGQAQAVPGVRRGRESFDGFKQIANRQRIRTNDHDATLGFGKSMAKKFGNEIEYRSGPSLIGNSLFAAAICVGLL